MGTNITQTTKIIVVRNGNAGSFDGFPNFDEEKKDQRPLTDLGISQVKKLGEHFVIKGLKVDLIITSSFKRARQTSTILGDFLYYKKCDILKTDSLVELDKKEEIVFQTSQDEAYVLATKRISKWFEDFICSSQYIAKLYYW